MYICNEGAALPCFSMFNGWLVKGVVIGPRVSVNAILAGMRVGKYTNFYWRGEKGEKPYCVVVANIGTKYDLVLKNIPNAQNKCAALLTSEHARKAEADAMTFVQDAVGASRPTDNAVVEIYNRLSSALSVPMKRDWALSLVARGFAEEQITACVSEGMAFWAVQLNERWWEQTITSMVSSGELKV